MTARNVVLISPGYPTEMPFFARGLARAGARVIGLGDQPADALPHMVREHLADYVHVRSFADEDAIVHQAVRAAGSVRVDQVESLWEPTMVLAARLRQVWQVPGMDVEHTLLFRDKERMKQTLDAAGIRTPHHYRVTAASDVRAAADHIGFPVIVKPIAGAGSANTYRADDRTELDRVLPLLHRVPEVSVEEFVDAEEFTYDTICARGEPLYENVSWYHPRPLITRQLEWVSPITMALRDMHADHLVGGVAMGRAVLKALGYRDGFTHMEWYRRENGEVVFGEIGARPPGARTVDVMNFASDTDLTQRWAEAVLHGAFSEQVQQRYNAASIMKRAQGQGRVTHIEGLGRLLAEYGEHICEVDLVPIGAPRRDWHASLISDGIVIVRHQELQACIDIAERFASELQLYAS